VTVQRQASLHQASGLSLLRGCCQWDGEPPPAPLTAGSCKAVRHGRPAVPAGLSRGQLGVAASASSPVEKPQPLGWSVWTRHCRAPQQVPSPAELNPAGGRAPAGQRAPGQGP